MRAARSVCLALACSALLAPLSMADASFKTLALDRLLLEDARGTNGVFGIFVRDVERGTTRSLHASQRFAMMSVIKLPIALEVLHQVDQGRLRLHQVATIEPTDIRPGDQPIRLQHPHGRISLSIADLLRDMLVNSDNSACDKLMALVGGARALQRRMNELGVSNISIAASELEMYRKFHGIRSLGPEPEWSVERFDRLAWSVPYERQDAAARTFRFHSGSSVTPAALAQLWLAVYRGGGLSRQSARLLMQLLAETSVAPGRIKGLLPRKIVVQHRPGTSGSFGNFSPATNDAGIVNLPNGHHLIVVVLLANSRESMEVRERRIALIARAAYDDWMAAGN